MDMYFKIIIRMNSIVLLDIVFIALKLFTEFGKSAYYYYILAPFFKYLLDFIII